jgi:hypothetical protein
MRILRPGFFFFGSTPSDISPAVPSPSLMTADGCGGAERIFDSFEGSTFTLTIDDLRGCEPGAGCEADGAGDIGLEGTGVDVLVGCDEELICFFLCFLRLDSLPLISEAERSGEPGRLRLLGFFEVSLCFGRPCGVLVPFDDAPDGIFDADFALSFASSSFLRFSSSDFRFSSSDSSSSVYLLSAK